MTWDTLVVPAFSLLGAMLAGVGLKIVERWLLKSKERDDTATNLRNELRAELTALKIEMQAVEKELDEWKFKYYDVIEKYIIAKAQLEAALKILRDKNIQPPEPPVALTGGGEK